MAQLGKRGLIFSVSGIRELEVDTKAWSEEALIEWLRNGFAQLAKGDSGAAEHLAFPPLRFHPGSAPIGQLASALSESYAADLGWAKRIRRMAMDRLQVDRQPSPDELNDTLILWRCMPALAPEADVAQAARRMLRWLGRVRPETFRNALLQVVLDTVDSAPGSPSQFMFFRLLKETTRPRLWRPDYVRRLLMSHLDVVQQHRAEAWGEICAIFGDDVATVLDPATPAGQALIQSLGEWLSSDAADETAEAVRAWLLELPRSRSRRRVVIAHAVERGKTELKTELEQELALTLAAGNG